MSKSAGIHPSRIPSACNIATNGTAVDILFSSTIARADVKETHSNRITPCECGDASARVLSPWVLRAQVNSRVSPPMK